LTLFQVVKDKKLPLDTYCYTAAIEACSKGGMSERALELLAEMERDKIKPSEVTYSVVITACGNGGLWQKSLELLAVMRTRQIPVNLYVYNAVITSLSKAAKRNTKVGESSSTNDNQQLYPIVMGLLDEMKQDGIKPDGFTYSSAISCCGAEGLWEEALQIIDMMRRGGPRTQPNKVAYTAAITSCGRAGQADCAIRLFDEMKEQGLQIDRVAYNALFSALRVAKKSDAAYRLWDEMVGTRDVSTTTSPTSNNRRIGTLRSLQTTTPDIITVTEYVQFFRFIPVNFCIF
jgi:pentatricopeptide repeat protein